MAATAQPIKSIDVGSMFLMDLALNDESEFSSGAPTNGSPPFSTTTNHQCSDRAVQETFQQQKLQDLRRDQLTRSEPMDAISHHDNHSAASNNYSASSQKLASAQSAELDQLDDEDQDYIISYVHNQRGNYCRLFKNIQGSYLNSGLHSNLWNQVKQQQQQQPPLYPTSNTTTGREHAGRSFSSSSSLSNLSLTASSDNTLDDSSSGSVISYSIINQFNAADENGRTSSTTRDEDSGIVRMIHLDDQQNIHNNSYDIDDYFQQQHQHQHHQRFYNKVKPTFDVDEETIMMETIEPTSDSARIHLNDSSYSERDNNKPTNNSHYYHNYSYRRDDDSRRIMSASLPIQVPPRQSDRDFKSSCEAAEASDFEEFLDQEYDRSSHYY